jgi:hypothetical protein
VKKAVVAEAEAPEAAKPQGNKVWEWLKAAF